MALHLTEVQASLVIPGIP